MISVIIPTFNRAGLLQKAASSVLAQSFKDLELIIVDDGSGDETPSVVESFKDRRIIYCRQENKGVSAARNLGLSASRGEYVAFLDSDDYWLPEKLRLQHEFMRETGFMISQTGEIWVRSGNRVNPMNKHAKLSGWIFEKSLDICLVSPSCVMMDRALVHKGYYFDEKLMACEDYDLWLRISLNYPLGFLPIDLTVRKGGRPDQLSAKIIGLDLFRIYSLLKLSKMEGVDRERQILVGRALQKKSGIYIRGCIKRGRCEEAQRVQELLAEHLRTLPWGRHLA